MSHLILHLCVRNADCDKTQKTNISIFPIYKNSTNFRRDIKSNMLVRKYVFTFMDKNNKILPNCILKHGCLYICGLKRHSFTPYIAQIIDNKIYGDKIPTENIYSITFDKVDSIHGLLNEGGLDEVILELEFEPQDEDIILKVETLRN